jgi:hypothetical protein
MSRLMSRIGRGPACEWQRLSNDNALVTVRTEGEIVSRQDEEEHRSGQLWREPR